MGSGASVESSVKEASQEDIQAAVDALTSDNRTKVLAALALSAGDGPLPAAAVPPEEERVSEAPFLKEYFELQLQAQKEVIDLIPTLLFEPNPEVRLESLKMEILRKMKEPLRKCFENHDSNGNGVLSNEEAALFFKHFIEENTFFSTACAAATTRQSIEMSSGMGATMMAQMAGSQEDKAAFEMFTNVMKAQCEEGVKAAVQLVKEHTDKQVADYETNKAERNAAAFAVMDTNGDGTLQRDEFENILLGDQENEKAQAFMTALGFTPVCTEDVSRGFTGALDFPEEGPGEDDCNQM